MEPILGNLDPYSGILNLTRTCLCTQVPKYNTDIWFNINWTYGIIVFHVTEGFNQGKSQFWKKTFWHKHFLMGIFWCHGHFGTRIFQHMDFSAHVDLGQAKQYRHFGI